MGGTLGLGKEKRQEAGNLQRSEANESNRSARSTPVNSFFDVHFLVLAFRSRLCVSCRLVPVSPLQVDGSTIQNIAYQYAPYWEWQGDDGIYVPYDSSIALMLEKAWHRKLPRRDSTCAVIRADIN